MIQRVQTLFLLLSAVCLGLFLWMPLIGVESKAFADSTQGWQIGHTLPVFDIPYIIFFNAIFIGTAIGFTLINIFLFKNRSIQMLLCWFFIYWLWKLDGYVPKGVAFLADISFGIFFIHHYFVIGLRYIQLNVLRLEISNVFVYWTLHFVLTIALTSALIVLVRKVAGKRSRVLIGC